MCDFLYNCAKKGSAIKFTYAAAYAAAYAATYAAAYGERRGGRV